MIEDVRHQLASDFAHRLVSSAARTYPDLPVAEATQLKAHDLEEAGLLTEPQHHDLFLAAAWSIPDQPGQATQPDGLAERLAADLVVRRDLFSPDEFRRLAKVELDSVAGGAGRFVADE